MQKILLKIAFGILILSLFVSCAAVKKLMPKEKRVYQEKSFDSKIWRSSDAQTRGEMSKDLRWKKSASGIYLLDAKTQTEILELLGEPDRKTRGKCCGAGGTSDEEVWLYNIEVKNDGNSQSENEHFQIYFRTNAVVDEIKIDLWDDKNPDYFPRVG